MPSQLFAGLFSRGRNIEGGKCGTRLTVPPLFRTIEAMLPEIEKLLVLQDRDRKIRTLKQELKIAPLEKKEMEDKLETALKDLEAARQKGREIEVERKKLENEAQSKRDSIAKFQTQKFQTRKNEEFQALNNEIKRFEGDIQGIEDRELDLMENAEKVKALVAETDRQTQATKALVARQITDLANKTQAVTEQLKELEAERRPGKGATAPDAGEYLHARWRPGPGPACAG